MPLTKIDVTVTPAWDLRHLNMTTVDRPKFQAFFSYTHHDADADPLLVEHFTDKLERLVGRKLVNATFEIWRDAARIRISQEFLDVLKKAISSSDILIIMLTPKWLESDYCRFEYEEFVNSQRIAGRSPRIVSLLAGEISQRAHHLNPEQRKIYDDLCARKYAPFTSQITAEGRDALLEEVARDIDIIIEELRTPREVRMSESLITEIKTESESLTHRHGYKVVSFKAKNLITSSERAHRIKIEGWFDWKSEGIRTEITIDTTKVFSQSLAWDVSIDRTTVVGEIEYRLEIKAFIFGQAKIYVGDELVVAFGNQDLLPPWLQRLIRR